MAQYDGLVIKSGIPTLIGVDTLRADRGADKESGWSGTVATGDACQVSGALTLQKAENTSTSPVIGIYDGVTGSVVREGVVVATFSGSCPVAGSAVYLSATAGALTGTKPTMDMLHEVGVVVDASASKILLQQKPVIALAVTPPPYAWIPNASGSGGLTQIRVGDGAYVNRVLTGTPYHFTLYDGTYVWASGAGTTNAIAKINPTTGATIGTWTKAAGRNGMGIAFDGTNYWYIVDGASDQLLCVDGNFNPIRSVTVGGGSPTDVIYDGAGNLWVTGNTGYNIYKVRASDGVVLGNVGVNFVNARSIWSDKTNVWVAVTRSGDGSTPADLKKIRISDMNVTTYSGFTGAGANGGFWDGIYVWFITDNAYGNLLYKVRASDGVQVGSWTLTNDGNFAHCVRSNVSHMWAPGHNYRVRKYTMADPPVVVGDYPSSGVDGPRDIAFTNIVLPYP